MTQDDAPSRGPPGTVVSVPESSGRAAPPAGAGPRSGEAPVAPETEAATDPRSSSEVPPVVAQRLDYIDGLRALAALWVVMHHTILASAPLRILSLPVLGPILSSLFLGQFPVMVFLLLSGFCLYYPYVKKNPVGPTFTTGYGPYLLRRAKRIAPPYYWAGTFCIVMAAFPQLRIGVWEETGPIDTKTIVSHVLFVHNLFPSYSGKIDYPMWSIGLEWQLYLIFPFLIWAFRKWNGLAVTASALLLAALIRASYRHLPAATGAMLHDGPFSYLEIFCAGMLAAALTAQKRTVAPKWVLGCVVAGGLMAIRLGSGNGLAHDLAATSAAFSVLLLAADSSTAMSRALSTKWLVRLGVFSYSIYLVHAPLLHLCWFVLRPLHLSPDVEFVLLAGACVPSIILICYGFHCLFERPFMRTKHAHPGRAADAPLPAIAGK